ncbi:hypothetical protein HNP25_000665 [Arcicella rosea]|uniref:Uncharacterized protein n=1 Tax=Arcicella rosea TaxID=502909 RepID=A0A841EG95_9BACT|nr:hypothetical protein [Arcicella rosea]
MKEQGIYALLFLLKVLNYYSKDLEFRLAKYRIFSQLRLNPF